MSLQLWEVYLQGHLLVLSNAVGENVIGKRIMIVMRYILYYISDFSTFPSKSSKIIRASHQVTLLTTCSIKQIQLVLLVSLLLFQLKQPFAQIYRHNVRPIIALTTRAA